MDKFTEMIEGINGKGKYILVCPQERGRVVNVTKTKRAQRLLIALGLVPPIQDNP